MVTTTIYAGLFLFAMYAALVRGTLDERRVGAVLLVGNSATIAVLFAFDAGHYGAVSTAYLGVDVACAIALCALASRSPSWMSVLIAAFQLNGTLAHVVRLLAPDTLNLSYAFLLRAWGWPMIITLIVAHWRTDLRSLLRQSDLQTLPRPLGVRPITARLPKAAVPPVSVASIYSTGHDHEHGKEDMENAGAEAAYRAGAW